MVCYLCSQRPFTLCIAATMEMANISEFIIVIANYSPGSDHQHEDDAQQDQPYVAPHIVEGTDNAKRMSTFEIVETYVLITATVEKLYSYTCSYLLKKTTRSEAAKQSRIIKFKPTSVIYHECIGEG